MKRAKLVSLSFISRAFSLKPAWQRNGVEDLSKPMALLLTPTFNLICGPRRLWRQKRMALIKTENHFLCFWNRQKSVHVTVMRKLGSKSRINKKKKRIRLMSTFTFDHLSKWGCTKWMAVNCSSIQAVLKRKYTVYSKVVVCLLPSTGVCMLQLHTTDPWQLPGSLLPMLS